MDQGYSPDIGVWPAPSPGLPGEAVGQHGAQKVYPGGVKVSLVADAQLLQHCQKPRGGKAQGELEGGRLSLAGP